MSITKISPDVVDFDAGITISTTDNTDTLTLTSTDADANAGPNLRLYRNSGTPADSDAIGLIEFEGRNDNTQDVVYAGIDSRIVDASDGTEDGRLEIVTMLAGTAGTSRILMDATETVFNDNSADLDFRVESDNSANALFVQGSDGRVGIGTSGPAYGLLDIRQTGTGAQDRGLYIEVSPSSSGSNNNAALISVGNGNMTNTVMRIHHESPAANQKLLSLDTTGSNTEKFWVDEDGDAYLAGSLAFASGSGIDFSATSNGSGTSSVSELLDDYEEGTWTPAISSGTATFSEARYTKIGRLVRFSYQVQGMDDITSANHILVSGLPFPVQAGESAGVAFGTQTDNASANVVYATTSETVYLYSMSSGTWDTMTHAELNSTSNYQYVAGTYQAES